MDTLKISALNRIYPVITLCLAIFSWTLQADDAVVDAVPIDSSDQSSLLRSLSPADFEQFAPKTALDVVNRIPGFALQEESSARGLGKASANVLLNGARVPGKTNGIVATLERIPASSITRVEMLEGASLGIPGLAGEVANIVTTTDRVAGSWRWEMQHRDHNRYVDPSYGDISTSISGKARDITWALGLDTNSWRLGHQGPERVSDAAGTLVETRQEDVFYNRDSPAVSLAMNFQPAGGSVANLNLSHERNWQHDREVRFSDAPATRVFERKVNEWNVEVSGDYEFDYAGGRLKLIGIGYYSSEPSDLTSTTSPVAVDDQEFASERLRTESIFRSEFSDRLWNGEWQWSFEVARNALDLESTFNSMPFADSEVEEERYEFAQSNSYLLTDALTLQTLLGVEYSRIEQTGDAEETRYFTRGKGFVSIAYALRNNFNVSFKIERSVGQLDFADFIVSVDVNDSNSDEGNPELEPQQSWDYELMFDYSIGQFGVVNLRMFFEDIEDIVDQIPVEGGGESVGNIDDAERYGAQLVATVHFDQLGWKGATLEVDILTQKSKLDDPLQPMLERRVNEDYIRFYTFELRQDVSRTDWAWGIQHEVERAAPVYRINEFSDDNLGDGKTNIFIENKDVFGLTAKLTAINVFDRSDNFRRVRYVDDRNGAVNFIEDRDRIFGTYYALVLSGKF